MPNVTRPANALGLPDASRMMKETRMLLANRKNDPLDLSRTIIKGHAEHLADFADMLARLIEMRDDDGAEIMRRRVVAEINSIGTAFKALAAGRIRPPAEAANA